MNLLPGWFPATAGRLTTVSFVDSSTSTASTITAPASVDAGDIMVLLDRGVNLSGTVTAVVPSGFTTVSNLLAESGSADYRQIVSYKITDGTEDSATLTGMNGAGSNFKALAQFRGGGGVQIRSATVQDLGEEASNDSLATQTCNASAGATPLIVLGGFGVSGSALSGRTFSPTADGSVTSSIIALDYKIYNSSPQDVTLDMDDTGSDIALILASFYLELA